MSGCFVSVILPYTQKPCFYLNEAKSGGWFKVSIVDLLSCGYPLSAAAQQATLLELLDAPQLMDTCVRNGIYDEALDLHAFIMRVALLHPDLPVVKLLAAQVRLVHLQHLLEQRCGGICSMFRLSSTRNMGA
jgi:hypothetical protein